MVEKDKKKSWKKNIREIRKKNKEWVEWLRKIKRKVGRKI